MRRAVVTIVVLLLVLGGGYIADTMLRGYVEDRVADAITAQFGEAVGAPSVGLGGFPFAWSLVTRSVPEARLVVDALPVQVSGTEVELTDVVADTGAISIGDGEARVASVTASANLGYDDLAELAEVPVTYAGDGRLELRYTAEVLGRKVQFAVSALPELDAGGQVIRLADPKLDLAGNTIDLGLSPDQLDRLVDPIDVGLDYGLVLTSIVANEDGLKLGIAGEDVRVPTP